mmetsp:Transcript_25592/g.64454  ORF Transcript_25592/g.64454 Transcript_25592/m.64454 type:complete len:80 (-) Transcript_25592:143-382(-)
MGDDSSSASELRNRFHQGGSMKDDQLSASQLRARHGVQGGTGADKGGGDGVTTILVTVIVVVLVVVGGLVYKMQSGDKM